ncbi:hypothetical protein EDD99_5162 [Streptomyces sp. 846.5]|nr:hypothetical protein EDD99_5162 [Streptomyces sp. 846.5]
MVSRQRRNKKEQAHREERRFTVRGVRRDPPDIRKLSRALISLAVAEAEREAQAEQAARRGDTDDASAGTETRRG